MFHEVRNFKIKCKLDHSVKKKKKKVNHKLTTTEDKAVKAVKLIYRKSSKPHGAGRKQKDAAVPERSVERGCLISLNACCHDI